MLLIGMYDSPFVRRVGIALRLYQLDFANKSLSVFRDAEKIAPYNPLRRAPSLVLAEGMVLTDSSVCLEVLDDLMATTHGVDWNGLLMPRSGEVRTRGLRLCALATGLMDKAVSLVYENYVRESAFSPWVDRCQLQISDTLKLLEEELRLAGTPFLLGCQLSHADIAVSCLMTFSQAAVPQVVETLNLPLLRALHSTCEGLSEFKAVLEPFEVRLPGN